MDKIVDHRKAAVRSLQMAKYLLTTTYPLLKEPKTLLFISDHIFSSFMSSISALLVFERNKKTIPPYHDNNESKLNCFKQNLVDKYKFKEYLDVIEGIQNLAKEHKKSDVEFTRDKKFVICGNQFNSVNTISENDTKDYITKAKEFITKVDQMVANE